MQEWACPAHHWMVLTVWKQNFFGTRKLSYVASSPSFSLLLLLELARWASWANPLIFQKLFLSHFRTLIFLFFSWTVPQLYLRKFKFLKHLTILGMFLFLTVSVTLTTAVLLMLPVIFWSLSFKIKALSDSWSLLSIFFQFISYHESTFIYFYQMIIGHYKIEYWEPRVHKK